MLWRGSAHPFNSMILPSWTMSLETLRLPKRLRIIILDAHEVVDHVNTARP